MKTTKDLTETYVITEIRGLDPVIVFIRDMGKGKGQIIIQCYDSAWSAYFGAIGDQTIQQFIIGSDNDYLIRKMVNKTAETDFDEINRRATEEGEELGISCDVEMAMASDQMNYLFGPEWYMDLPQRPTSEVIHLGKVLDAVREVFEEEARSPDKNGFLMRGASQ